MRRAGQSGLWRSVVLVVAPLSVCIFALIAACQWIAVGCLWWDCADDRPFDSRAVELPKELFPTDTTYGHLGPNSHLEGARQRESQTIFWVSDTSSSAVFTIARYSGSLVAARNYAQEIRIFKITSDTAWPRPAELAFLTVAADQSFIGCGELGGPRCAYVARYAEYLITFSATTDEEMTLQRFANIVHYIDTQEPGLLTR